ncbi:MAG: sensor histidine kinase [Solirubrobacterales bacterium]|nr:sensor histidine kinase [Solirubrobacterales bacterium]
MRNRNGSGTSLRTRVFLVNGLVFLIAGTFLALTPVTVSLPTSLSDALVLTFGLGGTVLLNLLVIGRTFAPLSRLIEAMERFEPLSPDYRVPIYGNEREIVQLTRAFNDMLDRIESERRESVQRSLAAQERERQRIAQELHDEIGQSLTALLLQVEGLARSVPDEERDALAELSRATRDTLDQVRDVARRLRPEVLDDLGLGKAITALCERLGAQSGVDINCAVDAELPQLAPEAELVAYRVAQEALTNTLRHSGAEHAALVLERDGDDVLLTIADDGRGIGDDAQPGSGIQGMRERALLIGARLRIDPGEPSGTVVRLRLDGQPYGGRPRPHETLGYG